MSLCIIVSLEVVNIHHQEAERPLSADLKSRLCVYVKSSPVREGGQYIRIPLDDEKIFIPDETDPQLYNPERDSRCNSVKYPAIVNIRQGQ